VGVEEKKPEAHSEREIRKAGFSLHYSRYLHATLLRRRPLGEYVIGKKKNTCTQSDVCIKYYFAKGKLRCDALGPRDNVARSLWTPLPGTRLLHCGTLIRPTYANRTRVIPPIHTIFNEGQLSQGQGRVTDLDQGIVSSSMNFDLEWSRTSSFILQVMEQNPIAGIYPTIKNIHFACNNDNCLCTRSSIRSQSWLLRRFESYKIL
jgi:hypothetical protein